jgi:hypothetical protein
MKNYTSPLHKTSVLLESAYDSVYKKSDIDHNKQEQATRGVEVSTLTNTDKALSSLGFERFGAVPGFKSAGISEYRKNGRTVKIEKDLASNFQATVQDDEGPVVTFNNLDRLTNYLVNHVGIA